LGQQVAGGFADDPVGGDQRRHAAEAVGAHLRTAKRGDGSDIAQGRRPAHDVLKDEFPNRHAARSKSISASSGATCDKRSATKVAAVPAVPLEAASASSISVRLSTMKSTGRSSA